MTFSNRVTTITQDTILPKIFDNVLTDNFSTFRFIGNGEKWTGETLKRGVKLAKNTNGSSFQGLDTFSTGTADTRQMMSFDLRGYSIDVSIPGMEKAVNSVSESQIISLIKTEMESSSQDGLDDIGSMFYLDGTGNSSKDFLGHDALNDDGTSVVTLGGLSRTTNPLLKGTRTSASGTMSLAKLATLYSAVSGGSAIRQQPTMIVSSEAEFDLYDSLLSPTVRANYDINGGLAVTRTSKGPIPMGSLKGMMGYTALVYRGVPWVKDEKAPAGTVWFDNENYMTWYGLQDPDLEQVSLGSTAVEGAYSEAPSTNTGLQWTGFMKPINQYGQVGHIILMGNFVTFQPRRLGRLTSVTGV